MPITLPPVPFDVPAIVETSFSHHYTAEEYGVDTAAQWRCETTRRPRFGDAIAMVYAPGGDTALLYLLLGASDLSETEATGHYAIRISRPLARLVSDPDDDAALDELMALLASDGPIGRCSQEAKLKVQQWLSLVRDIHCANHLPTLELEGSGWAPELWTVSMVAKHLGFTGPSAAGSTRKQLSRWGIESQGREPGRHGESLYDADQVKALHAARPGSGRRGAARSGGKFAPGSSSS